MRKRLSCVVVALAGLALVAGAFAAQSGWAARMAKARAQIGAKTAVPVYLPTRLPQRVTKYGIKRVIVRHTRGGYAVLFYYATQTSDATYAGSASGSTTTYTSLWNTRAVHLGDGAAASFRPVSCGGSCAPANLWWQRDGYEYQVQLSLPSTMPAKVQLAAVLVVANSMVRYPLATGHR